MRDKIKKFLLDGKLLDLNGYDITELPSIIPKEEIIDLDIGNNNKFNILPFLENVEILKCHANKLEEIPNFPKLKQLYCMRNNILTLHSFPNVEILNCDDNYIRHIPTMPKLRELRCMNCPIKTIDFQPNLEVLYISMNSIKELPLLPKLRKIIVHNFHSFMDYHFLEDTCTLLSTVIKQKIRYLKYYINIVKMQRRYRRNRAKTKLKDYKLCGNMTNKIIGYVTL